MPYFGTSYRRGYREGRDIARLRSKVTFSLNFFEIFLFPKMGFIFESTKISIIFAM